ncbi:filamentous hemagglutinin N-terminal domain-containing protein [Pseudanabaena sp. FACHB-2040]|uniref:two-partner secretion domain-containing protein n=1 Tax=Pseudanabaena sp. FACHB-2040 TaxID=2692859 RepID=UPI001684F7A1|nr:filamentous hemagglutinin N-terminal domain-containing protein [Pseudanabaena sp. FACHB-2040]MBD2256835.1 filamentous hemagglutinin N-terminal domain-containing protein [Pseudanabaena sp. FACHB-2040]
MIWQTISRPRFILAAIGSGLIGSAIAVLPASAQVTEVIPDGSLGTTVDAFPSTYLIEGGVVRDQNLFHSFETFNVGAGDGVYFFLPPGDLANIFARITGAAASSINGLVSIVQDTGGGFEVPDTNLFLINPYGVVFGEEAALSVGGAFVATTADTLQFGEAGQFSALNQEAPSPLLTVNPSAFLFTQAIPGSIVSTSRADAGTNYFLSPAQGLRVVDGQSLILLGDQVLIDNGGLNAFGGRIELGAIAGTGSVGLAQSGGNLQLSFPAAVERGDIALLNGAQLSVIGPDRGEIALYGRSIDIAGNSEIAAGLGPLAGDESSRAGDIEINATGRLRLSESSDLSNNVYLGLGSTGNIAIAAQTLELLGGSTIAAFTLGQGSSGNITIQAEDTIRLAGTGPSGEISQITSTILIIDPELESTAQIGNVTLQAPKVVMTDGSQLIASSFSPAINAGNIRILASDQFSLSGEGTLIQSITNNSGNAGDVEIQAGSVQVTNDAIITTLTNSTGNAGDVNIRAGSLQISNDAVITTLTNGTGDAGDINLDISGTARFIQGGRLVTATAAQGDAGDIVLRAGEDVIIDGVGRNEDFSGISSSADEGSQGQGGDILVTGRSLFVTQGGIINAATGGTGQGGTLELNLRDLLLVDASNITTLALQSTGGDIVINADRVRLSNSGDISTVVLSGEGGGGNIFMTARSVIALGDSDILAFSVGGSGGNIVLNTPAFFGENFQPAPRGTNPIELDGNDRVDVNASGAIASGAIALPDVSFIQNSLSELPDTVVNPDQLIAGSCIAPTVAGTASLVITGSDSLPAHPGEAAPAPFATGSVQAIPTPTSSAPWQPGDPIVEPNAVTSLANGRLVLARTCLENQ